MRCVICSSTLPDDMNIQCGENGCKAPLCPGDFGVECRTIHKKQLHPLEEAGASTSIMGAVKVLKDKLRAAEGRATIAEGLASHWQEKHREVSLNERARFSALVKFLNAAYPAALNHAERDGLASRADILKES